MAGALATMAAARAAPRTPQPGSPVSHRSAVHGAHEGCAVPVSARAQTYALTERPQPVPTRIVVLDTRDTDLGVVSCIGLEQSPLLIVLRSREVRRFEAGVVASVADQGVCGGVAAVRRLRELAAVHVIAVIRRARPEYEVVVVLYREPTGTIAGQQVGQRCHELVARETVGTVDAGERSNSSFP